MSASRHDFIGCSFAGESASETALGLAATLELERWVRDAAAPVPAEPARAGRTRVRSATAGKAAASAIARGWVVRYDLDRVAPILTASLSSVILGTPPRCKPSRPPAFILIRPPSS